MAVSLWPLAVGYYAPSGLVSSYSVQFDKLTAPPTALGYMYCCLFLPEYRPSGTRFLVTRLFVMTLYLSDL